MITIKHLNLYSAYSLLNKNIVITYKIDGIPELKSNYFIEKVDKNEYVFPKNFDLTEFFRTVNTQILNISTFNCPSTAKYILDEKNMINKYDGALVIKNFFYINSSIIYELLDILKFTYTSPFPNDGFIIYNLDDKKIYKLKPFTQMSIDLKKQDSFFYSNDIKLENLSIIHNDEKNGIYRCHPLDITSNNWIIGDHRNDKIVSNPLWLINKIRKLIREPFNYSELKTVVLNTYYDKYDINSDIKIYLDRRKEKLIHRLNNLIDSSSTILDFGCGFGNYVNNKNFNYYLGVDKDLRVLESINEKKRCNELWLDFSENLNFAYQVKTFGDIWVRTQKQNYKNLKKKYSLIIFNHSIHYVKNLKNILNFIKSNYKNTFVFIGTINIIESFENKYQRMEILEETKNTYKVKFFNSWINKELIETYYKIDYLKIMLNKYQINYSIQPYSPSILK